MELHELRPPDLAELRVRGDARAIFRSRNPRTLEEILQAASDDRDEADHREAMAADPVLWARAHRPRTLLNRLLGRC
jgi:hypothetical protein